MTTQTIASAMEALTELAARLRAPDGCPWDRKQTPKTLRPYTLEEAFEVIHAAETEDWPALRDELGDLLFHIALYSQIAQEEGHFTLADVAAQVTEKMIRRHPHVFGNKDHPAIKEVATEGVTAVMDNWEKIKQQEKKEPTTPSSVLAEIHTNQPALLWAQKVQHKMAKQGLDWHELSAVLEKLQEEIKELQHAVKQKKRAAIEEEMGDLLFTAVNLSRHLDIQAETALRGAVHKFQNRVLHMEKQLTQQNTPWQNLNHQTLERLWQDAKKAES
ncbi:nucleoside triphosphate pyrophosphohydrolase [Magnetococcales bacterium HHB-1]